MKFFLLFLLFRKAKKANLYTFVALLRSKESNASSALSQSYKSICRYSFLVLHIVRRLYTSVGS